MRTKVEMQLSGLCPSCENAHIINDDLVLCTLGFQHMRIRRRVDACTRYDQTEVPQKPFRWLVQDAAIFYNDSKGRLKVAKPRTPEHSNLE